MPEKQSTWGWIWRRVGDLLNIQALVGLSAGSAVASRVVSMLPGGWHPPQYWAIAGIGFFGGWLAVVVVAKVGRGIAVVVRPPRLNAMIHDGDDVTLEVCPTFSDVFYGTLQVKLGTKWSKPYELQWNEWTGANHPVRAGDKTTVILAKLADHGWRDFAITIPSTGNSWNLDANLFSGDRKLRQETEWVTIRLDLRGKGIVRHFPRDFRFRLTKDVRFEAEEI